MLSLSLFAVTVAVVAAGAAVAHAVVVGHDSAVFPAVVNAGGGIGLADPAADTLVNGSAAAPTLAGDWKRAELASLSEVEDLLDYLEARRVAYREMDVIDNDRFVVRWR